MDAPTNNYSLSEQNEGSIIIILYISARDGPGSFLHSNIWIVRLGLLILGQKSGVKEWKSADIIPFGSVGHTKNPGLKNARHQKRTMIKNSPGHG
jgi:hypothetical protein